MGIMQYDDYADVEYYNSDETSLLEHLNYEMVFRDDLDNRTWVKFVYYESDRYSNGIIDERFKFDVELDMEEKPNGEIGFLDITPHNNYTKIMLTLNKKSILRYHKLEKLKKVK